MPHLNNNKPERWKKDIEASIDLYNDWFLNFAPEAFRESRERTTKQVEKSFQSTQNLLDISPQYLKNHPESLPMLRMATVPPLARDRLMGLAGVSKNLVKSMEDADNPCIPPRMAENKVVSSLSALSEVITRLLDVDILSWVEDRRTPTNAERYRAATVIADRLSGAVANPIIKNAQEERQLGKLFDLLHQHGFSKKAPGTALDDMLPGTYGVHVNVPTTLEDGIKQINVSVDCVIVPKHGKHGVLPILIEAKSAGDTTNVNKRRKEEAEKMSKLISTYGDGVEYILLLTGYFDTGYLGYEAAERIDWIWEHRLKDLEPLLD